MAVVGNFIFLFFLRLTWDFLDLESERGGSICWPNNKIIDDTQLSCEFKFFFPQWISFPAYYLNFAYKFGILSLCSVKRKKQATVNPKGETSVVTHDFF